MQSFARAWLSFALLFVVACASGGGGRGTGGNCTSSSDCAPGSTCVDRTCVAGDGGRGDGGTSHGDGATAGDGSTSGDGSTAGDTGATHDDASTAPDLGPLCAGCDDGNACTTDSCDTGTCTHTALSCDDGSACTTDSCDPATGCNHTTLSCDDGSACTTDSCSAATGCAHAALSCDDGSACTTDSCSAASGCNHTTLSCDDGNACTTASCGPTTVTFPLSSDAAYSASGSGYYWTSGDYVQGARTTGLPYATSVSISLGTPFNGLSGDSCDFRMLINGIQVGTFSVYSGTPATTASFSFPAISGPTYTLRYEVTRTVISGDGAIQLDMGGGSTVTLSP